MLYRQQQYTSTNCIGQAMTPQFIEVQRFLRLEKFASLLRDARNAAGLSQAAAVKFLKEKGIKVGSTSLANWEVEEYERSPSFDKAMEILDTLNSVAAQKVQSESRVNVGLIPVIGSIQAGQLIEQAAGLFAEDYLPIDPRWISQRDDTLFGLVVKGDSMIGAGIFDGDIAICSTQIQPVTGDFVCYYNYDTGESNIKQLGLKDDESHRIQLIPHNPRFFPEVYELGPSDQLRKVVGIVRRIGNGE